MGKNRATGNGGFKMAKFGGGRVIKKNVRNEEGNTSRPGTRFKTI